VAAWETRLSYARIPIGLGSASRFPCCSRLRNMGVRMSSVTPDVIAPDWRKGEVDSSANFTASTSLPLRIIIPAHNEAARIEPTLREFCEHFRGSAEIVVVANGCTDDTAAVARRISTDYENLSVVEVPLRIGKGGAVRVGFGEGREPLVGFVDADGSTSAKEFAKLAARCQHAGLDGVIGSRWAPGADVFPRQPLMRRLASRTFNVLVRLLFGLPFQDTQCGAKVFRREALAKATPHLQLSNFAFDVDLLFHLRGAQARVEELPIAWRDANGSKVRLARAAPSMLLGLVRLRILNSVLAWIPFIDFIARDAIIPVARPLSVLVLGNIHEGRTDRATEFIFNEAAQLKQLGATVSWAHLERKNFGLPAMLLWYVLEGHRLYDVIVELESSFPMIITAVSSKPTYLVACDPSDRGGPIARFIRRALYGGVRRIEPSSTTPSPLKDHATSRIYRITLWHHDGSWLLRYVDGVSGEACMVTLQAHRGNVDLRAQEHSAV
jgi:dolichol-phosphate mannosyltransferase